ncbi:MAG: hypothetical protein KVP17_000725 [Porospora cf. gigantea B]|nr:MAG: hypothetical protein KVP17_000725 [Porospora cf. gigantea B]
MTHCAVDADDVLAVATRYESSSRRVSTGVSSKKTQSKSRDPSLCSPPSLEITAPQQSVTSERPSQQPSSRRNAQTQRKPRGASKSSRKSLLGEPELLAPPHSARTSVVPFDHERSVGFYLGDSSDGARSRRTSHVSSRDTAWRYQIRRMESRRRSVGTHPEQSAPDFNSLFTELQQGGDDLTKNLKHLTVAEKQRRASATLAAAPSGLSRAKTLAPIDFLPLVEPVAKSTVVLVHGREWVVENAVDTADVIEIIPTKMMQNVSIRNCQNCTVRVDKKCNSIMVENCRTVNVIADSLIASFEIVRCQKIQVQVMNNCFCYTLDGVDGCTIFLSESGREAQIVASRIAEVNVSFPSHADPEEWIKRPVPEQFVYTVNKKDTVDAKVSELYG